MEHTTFEADTNGHTNGHTNLTEGEMLGITEAAELLGVHKNTIRYRIKQGHYHAT